MSAFESKQINSRAQALPEDGLKESVRGLWLATSETGNQLGPCLWSLCIPVGKHHLKVSKHHCRVETRLNIKVKRRKRKIIIEKSNRFFQVIGASLVAQRLKHLPGMWETHVWSLGREDPLEKENGTPLQYSCLENPMDGGAWWATVHGVTKSQTRLSDFTFTFHFHALEKEMALQYSCLGIPGTVEPVGLPVYGVAQSRTRLKRLSSSSSSRSSASMCLCFLQVFLPCNWFLIS